MQDLGHGSTFKPNAGFNLDTQLWLKEIFEDQRSDLEQSEENEARVDAERTSLAEETKEEPEANSVYNTSKKGAKHSNQEFELYLNNKDLIPTSQINHSNIILRLWKVHLQVSFFPCVFHVAGIPHLWCRKEKISSLSLPHRHRTIWWLLAYQHLLMFVQLIGEGS